MDQEQVLKIARDYVSFLSDNDIAIQKAYLFGSSARGTQTENSDIDLALTFRGLPNSFLMQMQLMKLSWKFDARIEPHPFDDADFKSSHPFAKEILETGIRVI